MLVVMTNKAELVTPFGVTRAGLSLSSFLTKTYKIDFKM